MNNDKGFYVIIYEGDNHLAFYNDSTYLKWILDYEDRATRYKTLDETIEVVKSIYSYKFGKDLYIRKMEQDTCGILIWGTGIRLWDNMYKDKNNKWQFCKDSIMYYC